MVQISKEKKEGIFSRLQPTILFTPVILVLVLVVLYFWVHGHKLDFQEKSSLNQAFITRAIKDHLFLTFVSAAIILVISVPLGVILTRRSMRFLTPIFLILANAGQAVPLIGLLILMGIEFNFGYQIAIASFAAYGILPILRNTIVGLQQIDPFIVESARGMGMTSRQALFKIELPLAVPVILAGIRTTLILTVGAATFGVFVNGGGLGTIIQQGNKLNRPTVLITGATFAIVLAFAIDWVAKVIEEILRPRGI
jgi:osmoprotectant transport system permease protein